MLLRESLNSFHVLSPVPWASFLPSVTYWEYKIFSLTQLEFFSSHLTCQEQPQPMPQGLAFFDAMLWLQQNKCSKCLGPSNLPFRVFFSFLFAWLCETEPKETESPGFAWCCRKIKNHQKTPFPAQFPSQSWIRTYLKVIGNLIPWLNLLVASLCLFSFFTTPLFASGAQIPS